MKSFFQLSEQARRHKAMKMLREADGEQQPKDAAPAAGVANQQTQNDQSRVSKEPKATNAPEMSDADLVQQLATNWDAFMKQNNAAMTKLKELESAKQLAQTLNNLPGELKKVVVALKGQDNAAGGKKPANDPNAAGSNSTGSGAGGTPPPTPTPAAPPGGATPPVPPA